MLDVSTQTEELRAVADRRELVNVPGYHLSLTERQLLTLLLKRNHVHRDVAWTVLYAGKPECDQASLPNIDVHISHLRKKLPIVEIRSDRANGWWLDVADKQKLNKAIASGEPLAPKRGKPKVGPIEKDVPVPAQRRKESPFRFAEMQINDSFLVTGVTSNTVKAAAHHFRTRTPGHESWRFVVRDVDDGVRVWRAS